MQIRDLWGQFRDWRIWRDPRATEAARRCRMATPVLPGHPQRATPPVRGLASRDDRSRVAGRGAGASAEGEVGERSERWRCGNVVRGSASRLQCKFKGKSPRTQRQTHRLKAGELRSATRACCGARATAVSLSGEMASRDLVRSDGLGQRFGMCWRTSLATRDLNLVIKK